MRHSRAFTLLELVIVLGLIVVLAGLTVPVVARTRENARLSNCISNLHQIDLALRMYVQDNGGRAESMPDGLAELYPTYVTDPRVFECPSLSPEQGDYQKTLWECTYPAQDGSWFRISYLYLCANRGGVDPETGPYPAWWADYYRRGDDFPIVVDVGHTTEKDLQYDAGLLILLRMGGKVEKKRVRYPGPDTRTMSDL